MWPCRHITVHSSFIIGVYGKSLQLVWHIDNGGHTGGYIATASIVKAVLHVWVWE